MNAFLLDWHAECPIKRGERDCAVLAKVVERARIARELVPVIDNILPDDATEALRMVITVQLMDAEVQA